MKIQKAVAIIISTVMVASLAACSGGSTAQTTAAQAGSETTAAAAATGETLELQAGHVLTEDSAYHIALTGWADEVNQATDGRIKINVFANSVLGSERDMIESLQNGTLDITLPNSAPMANFTDAFKVFDLPFLFQTPEEAYAVIDSEIGDGMLAQLDAIGIKGLSLWENGFRYVANNKKDVYTPDDLKGLKIRTMENEIHMASFRSWGADATAMAWGEVYTGVQQGTIDGLENPMGPIYQNALHEVAPHITMTGHFYCPAPLLVSKATWEKISPEDQAIMIELANKYKTTERELCAQYDKDYADKMVEEGCTVITADQIDKSVWREAAQSVYDSYQDQIGADLINKIKEVTEKK